MRQTSVPGSPSQVGSKPGDPLWGTKQLVASWGRVGSNPTPGAFLAQILLSYFFVIRCAGVPLHVEVHFFLLFSLVAAHFIRGIIAFPSSMPS